MVYETLNNGLMIPLLGFGTYGVTNTHTLMMAIDCGYRLFDTAQMYGNQSQVGAAIRDAMRVYGLKREEFFVTTKLSSNMSGAYTMKSIESTLKILNLDYIDLLLLHEPYAQSKAMYNAMESAYKQGKLKAIGVSNFIPSVFSEFVKTCEIPPAINQCEVHIYYQQPHLLQAMKAYGTLVQSWSPFIAGKSELFANPSLIRIAHTYHKSVAQVALRFLVQQGIIAIPKACNLKYMQENLEIFDFTLSVEDMQTLRALDTNTTQFSWGY